MTHRQFSGGVFAVGLVLSFIPYIFPLGLAVVAGAALILFLGELKPVTPPDED